MGGGMQTQHAMTPAHLHLVSVSMCVSHKHVKWHALRLPPCHPPLRLLNPTHLLWFCHY
jgi:hypothetical protein